MTTAAEQARAIGRERGIAVLIEPEVSVARIGDGHLLALAVAGAIDADAYYRCPYDGGAAFVLVSLSAAGSPHSPPAQRAGTVVQAALANVPIIISRGSVIAYLASIGAKATIGDRSVAVEDGPTFTFDELGRLTGIEESARLLSD